jgi:hypothetical protein
MGIMVGDIFAIQHDVNLRSEILDMPDFFWNEEDKCELGSCCTLAFSYCCSVCLVLLLLMI